MLQLYVLYAPRTVQDNIDVLEALKDHCSFGNNLNSVYNPPNAHYISYGKQYLIGFTKCLSSAYMSNNEVHWYKRIILTKDEFIFYMLNHDWKTFGSYSEYDILSLNNVLKWLKENMPPQYCNKCIFEISKTII